MNNRFIIMVLDGFGAGEAPDADKYGDCGSATLQHIYEQTHLELPNMKKLGIFNIDGINLENKEENELNNLSLEEHYKYYEKQGLDKKEIIKKIAKDRNVNKNEIYQYFLKNK